MIKDKRSLILQGNLYKVIGVLALPIMVNNLIQTLYNLVDGVWVSKIGSVEFAATAFVWPVNFLFVSIGIGLSIAGTSIISQFVGSNSYDEAKEYSSQLIAISLVAALIFSLIGYLASPHIIRLMGGTGKLAKYGNIYLRITCLDMPFMFLFFNFNSIMNAQGNTLIPTLFSGISALLNMVLDPIFIFTFNMGVAGAAIATLISRAILAAMGITILLSGKTKITPSFKNFRFKKEILDKIIKIALPSTIGQSGSSIGFMVLNGFIVSYGPSTLAAFAMVNRITSLVMQPAMGIGAALTAIVGQNLGSEQVVRAKEAFVKAIQLTVVFSALGISVMLLFDTQIINFFMQAKDDMMVIEEGITYLHYIAWSMPLMGIFSILQGVFQGSGHTKNSMAMEIGRLWFVRLPMILAFKHFTMIGSTGIWFSMSFSNLIVCVFGYILYRRGRWQVLIVHSEKQRNNSKSKGYINQ